MDYRSITILGFACRISGYNLFIITFSESFHFFLILMCSFNTSCFIKVRKVDICCVNGSNLSWDKDLHLSNKFQLRKKIIMKKYWFTVTFKKKTPYFNLKEKSILLGVAFGVFSNIGQLKRWIQNIFLKKLLILL